MQTILYTQTSYRKIIQVMEIPGIGLYHNTHTLIKTGLYL